MNSSEFCVMCEDLIRNDLFQLNCGCMYHRDCFNEIMLFQAENKDDGQYNCCYCKTVVADEYVTAFNLSFISDVAKECFSLACLLRYASIIDRVSV